MGGRALILLDTHVLAWLDGGSARLGPRARRAADKALAAGELGVSAITFWEVATLRRKGRLGLAKDTEEWRTDLLHAGLHEIPLSGELGIRAAGLRGFHADPADRLIVATALRDGAGLMTADHRILDWSGDLRRLDATS